MPSVRRALNVPSVLEEVCPVNRSQAITEPVFASPVDITWFAESETNADSVKQAKAKDLSFFLSRQESETRPSWAVFNQSV